MLERPVFIREQSDGLYRPMTYLIFKTLEEVILTAVTSLAFSLLVFYTVRLQGSFFIVWLVFMASQLVGVGEPTSHGRHDALDMPDITISSCYRDAVLLL